MIFRLKNTELNEKYEDIEPPKKAYTPASRMERFKKKKEEPN